MPIMTVVWGRLAAVMVVPMVVVMVMTMLLCTQSMLSFGRVHVGHRGQRFWNGFMKERDRAVDR